MDTFFRFLYEFLQQFFSAFILMFKGIFNGIIKMFDIKSYIGMVGLVIVYLLVNRRGK